MKQRTTLSALLSILAAISIATVVTGCDATGSFDKKEHETGVQEKNDTTTGVFDQNDPATWFASAESGGVDDIVVEQIKVGMTFDEIVAILGKPQRDIGSGALHMEWELKSGKNW